ncbi:class I SAM-dependent methyltransferase [Candidatus Roizmanbacteria bacterium]|nr:class I SAM-dependent methyltransferase [Candidatus Roizmanbacteria bacterium]
MNPQSASFGNTSYYLGEIAKLNHLRPGEISTSEVSKLYNLLSTQSSNDPNNLYLIQKYFGLGGSFTAFKQKKQQFLLLAEGLLNLEPKTFTYGSFLPSFQKILNEVTKVLNVDRHVALLVTHNPGTSQREFVKTVTNVSAQGYTVVLQRENPIGNDQQKFAHELHVGNALDMPFTDASFHSVHSILFIEKIDTLFAPPHKIMMEKSNRVLYFEEAFRVLKKGGVLLVIESDSTLNSPSLIHKELEDIGFQSIQFEKPEYVINRRFVDEVLKGILPEIPASQTIHRKDMAFITAVK